MIVEVFFYDELKNKNQYKGEKMAVKHVSASNNSFEAGMKKSKVSLQKLIDHK